MRLSVSITALGVSLVLAIGISPNLFSTVRGSGWLRPKRRHMGTNAGLSLRHPLPRTVLNRFPRNNQTQINSERPERRQAEAAIEQLKRGERPDEVWALFRQSANPTVRSYLVNSCVRLDLDPELLIAQLKIERDTSARRALILTLGGYRDRPSSEWRALIDLLRSWYITDPDPGTHSAVEWLLRRWNRQAIVESVDESMRGRKPGPTNWYVTTEGQTLAIIRNPPEYVAGSANERGRTPDEILHPVRIPRSFAIAVKEVTVGQFQRFLSANPKLEMRYPDARKDPHRDSEVMKSHSPEDDCPQIVVTWYEAAQYCNWLSQRDGIPRSEWVYPTDLNQIKSGMSLPADYLHRTGYRLLTEAEWEFAARAGSTTSRFYGDTEELLGEYAVYARNPPKKKGDPNDPNDPQRTARVGSLKPNDFGIFDIYGNVWEWIQDRRLDYPANVLRVDDEDKVLVVNDEQWRMRRGGSFTYDASVMRSAHRGRPDGYLPNERRDSVGFRIGRTWK